MEAEIEQLLSDRKRLRIDRPKWLGITLSKKLEKLRMVAKAPVLDRLEFHAIFKSRLITAWTQFHTHGLIGHRQRCGVLPMTIHIAAVQPLVALIAGILILLMPRILNYVIAIYLILIGLIGLFPNLVR